MFQLPTQVAVGLCGDGTMTFEKNSQKARGGMDSMAWLVNDMSHHDAGVVKAAWEDREIAIAALDAMVSEYNSLQSVVKSVAGIQDDCCGRAPAPRWCIHDAARNALGDGESTKYIEDLMARGQAARRDADGTLSPGVTHEVVDDAKTGEPTVTRRRFEIS